MANISQKEIASWLDRAAGRAELVDANPATRNQIWFIAGLMIKAGDTPSDWDYGPLSRKCLTSKRASWLIDKLTTTPKPADAAIDDDDEITGPVEF